MNSQLEYSFDDEPVIGFYYDLRGRRIEVHFEGYYNLRDNDRYVDRHCTFVIENWKKGKSKVGDDQTMHDLEKHMGIFTMILYMKVVGNELELFVSTVDGRYVILTFEEPELRLDNC